MQFRKENFIKYTAIVLLDSCQKGMLFNLKFSRTCVVGYGKQFRIFVNRVNLRFKEIEIISMV